MTETFATETVPLDSLRPHGRNYQQHPDDELDHIAESIRANGVYRNIVVARDLTILAGHGVVSALRRMGETAAPVYRLDIDPDDPRALKVLAGDNEIRHLAEVDDRALSELLKEIGATAPAGLLGTGYDEAMLANLLFVTRPASEIADFDAAAAWSGMPDYESAEPAVTLLLNFRTQAAKDELVAKLGLLLKHGPKSAWWPPEDWNDVTSIKFEDALDG